MNKKIIPFFMVSLLLAGCLSSNANNNTPTPDPTGNVVDNLINLVYVKDDGHYVTFSYQTNPFEYKGQIAKYMMVDHKSAAFDKLENNQFRVFVRDVNAEQFILSWLNENYKTYLEYTFRFSGNHIVQEFDTTVVTPTVEPTPTLEPTPTPTPTKEDIVYPEGYNTLDWHDEFDGNSLDTSKWGFDLGNGSAHPAGWGWGNGESQSYTDHNHSVKDGYLTITAKKEYDDQQEYTSSRLVTKGKYSTKYGYIEARISLPLGQGFWPAFWMLPEDDSPYGYWPHSGEIDIMEARGRLSKESSSAIHYSDYNWGHKYNTGTFDITQGTINDFHKYAVKWEEDRISFYVDDVLNFYSDKSDWTTGAAPGNSKAPFDYNFHIILNLAIGGHFDGYVLPDDNLLPAEMKIDYVRVFKK